MSTDTASGHAMSYAEMRATYRAMRADWSSVTPAQRDAADAAALQTLRGTLR